MEMFSQLAEADVMHGLIEGDNLDLAHPTPWEHGQPLAELNLAAMWRNYKFFGHYRLIYTKGSRAGTRDRKPGPEQGGSAKDHRRVTDGD